MRILAVDDEPIFCELLRAHLAQLGQHDVQMACSGPEAFSLIKGSKAPFECFLVDLRMIPMDGIELIRNIRRMAHHQATPIIVISALHDKTSIDNAFLAGANDYITKPLDLVELKVRLSMVHSILFERSQTRLVQERLVQQEAARVSGLTFDNAMLIEDVENAIPLRSMENFLLKQGVFRLRNSRALGFHIPKAETYFHAVEAIAFADLIGDFADVIAKSLRKSSFLLSYLGSGDLVAVIIDRPNFTALDLRYQMRTGLNEMASRYGMRGVSVPSIRLGEPVRNRPLSLERPTQLIIKARNSARLPTADLLEASGDSLAA